MVTYKMLGLDVNSNPRQYRTWIVANNPDLDAQFYYGYKSGTNPLVDISAYAVNDSAAIVGFNLPLPADWNPGPPEVIKDFPIQKVLPATCEDSQLAIIDGYAYMFGSKITASIYKANLNNPTDWTDTGSTLPTALYGSALAIVDGYIYLFGGSDGYQITDTIFSAHVSNPLAWTNHGHLLPKNLQYSSLSMVNGHLYLFGGLGSNGASNVILTASISNPLVWTDTGHRLPTSVYGSSFAQIDGYFYLFGGKVSTDLPTNSIWSAPISSPISWLFRSTLPYETSFGQFVAMGNDGYLIGPAVGQTSFTGFTPIIQCHLSSPTVFFDTNKYVRGQISHSNLAVIYDRIWLFGGSGETAIFACNQRLKYNLTNQTVKAYGNITRAVFPATDNLNNPYQVLNIPYWRTDYSMSLPPVPPPVPL